jgi:hypothetical protein
MQKSLNRRDWLKLVIFSMAKYKLFMTPSTDQGGAGGGVYRSQKTVRGCYRRCEEEHRGRRLEY